MDLPQETPLEGTVLDLLAERDATKARDFMLAWNERRNASWTNAVRDAETRAASAYHRPQIRGQLRHHLGEVALADATRAVGATSIPLRTQPSGGAFIVARLGRFALLSICVPLSRRVPRRSVTRKLLSEPNDDLEPQGSMPLTGEVSARGATELAYLGCMVAVPNKLDPTVPAELVFAVPNVGLSDWLVWMPLHRAYMRLQERADTSTTQQTGGVVPDKAFPKFRLPKRGDGTVDGEQGT